MEPTRGGCRNGAGAGSLLAEIEREVLGRAEGGTGWTDHDEADRIGARLALGPSVRVLDVGAGVGWPGLYLAARHGCQLTLADLPVDDLRTALRRRAAKGVASRCDAVVAAGSALPFAAARFDAVFHCDVLC